MTAYITDGWSQGLRQGYQKITLDANYSIHPRQLGPQFGHFLHCFVCNCVVIDCINLLIDGIVALIGN